MRKKPRLQYNCERCPAYCCSYPRIQVTKKDLRRLADYFGISVKKALQRFTKRGDEKGERVLRHRQDEHFGTVCRFLDRETRRCKVYDIRPQICREYPGTARCGYYDFLCSERRMQEDPEFVATAYNP